MIEERIQYGIDKFLEDNFSCPLAIPIVRGKK